MPVGCGVTQGSLLGPLFFLLYVNDMLPALQMECKVKLYADDTVLYLSGVAAEQITGELQVGLNRFSTWCIENK